MWICLRILRSVTLPRRKGRLLLWALATTESFHFLPLLHPLFAVPCLEYHDTDAWIRGQGRYYIHLDAYV